MPKGSFSAVCGGCGRYLHSCDQCRLFVVSSHRCASSTTELPADSSHKNFCEEFEALNRSRSGDETQAPDEARSRFMDLFGGKG
jgi:hypothetical protein